MKKIDIIQSMLRELNDNNSANYKKTVLSNYASYELVRKVLYYTYNPFYQYYVTPESLEKNYYHDLGTGRLYDDMFDLFDDLRSRTITGHSAINSVNMFCRNNEGLKDIIYKIIGKDLEIRMGSSLINKVIPGLIPSFDVALATPFEDVSVDFTKDIWYASRKLDGVRCLAVIDENGAVSLWSRQGNEFETLQKVKDEIAKLNLRDKVLDGEICLVDNFYEFELENGNVLKLHENDTVITSNGSKLAKDCTINDIIYL